MIRIESSDYVTSVAPASASASFDLPEICVAGKSNVGKSSFINALAGRNALARTSGTPGRTRMINYFRLTYRDEAGARDDFHLVDLPGYGFAKVSKSESASWGPMIERYLRSSENIKAVILLVDMRHDPGEHDKQMLHYLRSMNLPYIVIATKSDKVPKSKWHKRRMELAFELKLTFASEIVLFSALSKKGLPDALAKIEVALNGGELENVIDGGTNHG